MSKFPENENLSKNLPSDNDRSIANTQFEQIVNACETQDRNALKALFSKKAISETPDIDESIVGLFNFFQGEVLSYDDWGGDVYKRQGGLRINQTC